MRHLLKSVFVIGVAAALATGFGCTTGARQGAVQGGVMGFVGGAAAGAVNGVLFGGGALEGALQGGISGAAGGAAAGAMAGGMTERQAMQAQAVSRGGAQDIDALRNKLGDLNFQAAVYLVQGSHKDAIAMANRAVVESRETNRKVFALTMRAVAENEMGDSAAAGKTYQEIAKIDPNRSIDRARGDTMQAMIKIHELRQQYGITAKG